MQIVNLPIYVYPKTMHPDCVYGGRVGDVEAYALQFILDAKLINADYKYRVEYINSAGGYDTTDLLTPVDGTITVPIISGWTQVAGYSKIRLAVTNSSGMIMYTADGTVNIAVRDTGTGTITQETVQTGLTELITETHTARDNALAVADNFNTA